MAKQAETNFKERLRPKLDKVPRSWWLKVSLSWISGIPDYLGVVEGRFVALELKKSRKEKPRKLQSHILQLIERAGGLSFVVFPENHLAVLDQLRNLKHKAEQ